MGGAAAKALRRACGPQRCARGVFRSAEHLAAGSALPRGGAPAAVSGCHRHAERAV